MEKVNLVELAKHIVSLQRDIYAEISRSGKINPEKAALLADCRDYCFYLVLDTLAGFVFKYGVSGFYPQKC